MAASSELAPKDPQGALGDGSNIPQQVACLGMKLLFPHSDRLTQQVRLFQTESERPTHAHSSVSKSENRLQVHVDNCPQGIIKAVMLPLSNHCIGNQSLNPARKMRDNGRNAPKILRNAAFYSALGIIHASMPLPLVEI